jgi:CDP-glucose 4,6-dehydratase
VEKIKSLKGPVLITGHTGFKGTWLTLLLEFLEVEVVGISLEPESHSLYSRIHRESKIREYFVDIRDQETLGKRISDIAPSTVIHLAAQPLVLESYRNPRSTFDTNVMGTMNLLNCLDKQSGRTTVVIATTDKVYENKNLNRKFSESDSLRGKDPYSSSKVGTESVVDAWRSIWEKKETHQICSVRAGNVVGGGDFANQRLIPDIIRGFISSSPVEVRNPTSTRPWQHAIDPLVGYLMSAVYMAENPISHSFNFGPTEPSISVESVIALAKQGLFEKVEFSNCTEPAVQALEAQFLDLDSSLALTKLGWSPRWSQIEALKLTFQWWTQVIQNEKSAEQACLDDIVEYFE